jgi:hypothetical protein
MSIASQSPDFFYSSQFSNEGEYLAGLHFDSEPDRRRSAIRQCGYATLRLSPATLKPGPGAWRFHGTDGSVADAQPREATTPGLHSRQT